MSKRGCWTPRPHHRSCSRRSPGPRWDRSAHRRIGARQNGKPLPPRHSAGNGTPGPAPLTVAAILHQAIGVTGTTQDFNLFGAFLDLAASLLGAAGGFLVGGPGGAVIGTMIAHEWMVQQAEEGYLLP